MKFVVTNDRSVNVRLSSAPCGNSWLEDFEVAGNHVEPEKLWVVGFTDEDAFEKFVYRNGPCTIREHPSDGLYNISESKYLLVLQLHTKGPFGEPKSPETIYEEANP